MKQKHCNLQSETRLLICLIESNRLSQTESKLGGDKHNAGDVLDSPRCDLTQFICFIESNHIESNQHNTDSTQFPISWIELIHQQERQ